MAHNERPALIRLLHDQAPLAVAMTGANAVLLVVAAWGHIDTQLLLAWLATLLLLIGARLHAIRAFRRAAPDDTQLDTWAAGYVRGALLSGLLWGLATVMLIQTNDLVLQSFAAFIMGGMAAAAAVTHTALRSAYFAFILPMLLPMPVLFMVQGGRLHWVMAALTTAFLVLISRTAQRSHQVLRRSIALGQANSELVAKLTASHARLGESEQLFRTLAETTSTAIFAYREHFEYANPAAERLCGYSEAEMKQMPYWQIVHPDHRELLQERGQRRLRGESMPSHYEFKILTKDGGTRWVEFHAGLVSLGGLPTGLGSAFDITARKAAEEALLLEKEQAQITLSAIGDAVVTTDTQGRIVSLNPSAERLAGLSEAEALGRDFAEVFHLLCTEGEPIVDPVALCLAEGRTVLPSEPRMLLCDEAARTVEITVSPLSSRAGQALGAVAAFHDVSVLHQLGQEMSYHASHDVLTGLVNRREFLARLEGMLASAQREGAEHALCYLDLDQFKVVNDSCGHLVGDELLKQVTALLRQPVREGDTLARLGGDEFGLLLAYCPLPKAAELAERLRAQLRDYHFVWEGRVFEVGASIGVVPVTSANQGVDDLLRTADAACYVAKEEGRNRVHVYRPDDMAVAEHHSRLAWVGRINQGLKEDRFVLYAQRILSLTDPERRNHFEVLIRLQDTDGSPIPPGAFLPTAERYRLMPELDSWVVRKALDMLAPLLRSGRAECALNLSGQSLAEDGMLELILGEIRRHQIPPASVCLEITETSAISHLAKAVEFTHGLKAAGCKLALDDFGSGLSSFSYLKQLPVDYLKIDGAFVRDIEHDPVDLAICQSIVFVARNMGKQTIAECVENEAVLEQLMALEVDFGQGYHLERPRPLSQLIAAADLT